MLYLARSKGQGEVGGPERGDQQAVHQQEDQHHETPHLLLILTIKTAGDWTQRIRVAISWQDILQICKKNSVYATFTPKTVTIQLVKECISSGKGNNTTLTKLKKRQTVGFFL